MKLNESCLIFFVFILAGCQNVGSQNKPVVLFENIYVGDNLETCLAKGYVQYNPDYNNETLIESDISMIELANNYIASTYFTNSGVVFGKNNIVKEIKLKFQQKKTGKTAKDVFNYMTQYFCQRYQGMETEILNIEKEDDRYKECRVKFKQEGLVNIWETAKIKIILKSYDNTLMDRYNVHKTFNPESFDALGYLTWLDIDSKEGKWIELNIIVK